ncbi:MAG: Gldg family protein, partial [Armatimonadota bacterium]
MRRVTRSKLSPLEAVAIKAGWTGVAALTFAVVAWAVEDRLSPIGIAAIGLGVALVGTYLSVHWPKVIKAFRSRSAAAGANTASFLLAVAGIVVLVNYISSRHHYQLDLTRTKKFSLAPVSRNVVRNLKSRVTATAWVAETSYGRVNPDYEKARDLLAQYQAVSPKISFAVKDPRRYRDEAIRAGVKTFPVIMLTSQDGKRAEITSIEEKDLTLGFIKLVKGSRKKVYFAMGHGMPSVTDWGPEGLSRAKETLESLYHKVETVDLSADRRVPRDCAVLVVPGPKSALLPAEEDAIDGYLRSGGHVL